MTTPPPAPECVTSRDGTRIGYLHQGRGPAVVLVQGAMADVHAYRDLATALAASHTVIRAERRGRGLSPRVFDEGHRIERDVEDLAAVMEATGARTVFGLSSGAVIALEAARTLDLVERAVAYEPPFYDDDEHGPRHGQRLDRAAVARLFADLERGDLPSALLDSLLAAGTAPASLARLPRPVARLAARITIALDAHKRGPAATFRDLLPGVRFDFTDVVGADGRIAEFAAIPKPLLLLSGTSSPEFLQRAIRRIHELNPAADRHEFPGIGHDGPWNGGDPTGIADVVRDFMNRSA